MHTKDIALYILTFALSGLMALYGTPIAMQAAVKFGIVDKPDGRLKVQREPVPYLGGLAIYMAFLLSLALTFEFSQELLGIMLGGTIIVLLGLIDDFGVLTPEVKMLGQIIAAFVLIKSGTMIYLAFIPFWLRIFLTVFWIVGVTNAFNILDVMDGLSSGVAAVAAASLSVIALINGKMTVAIMAIALTGACIGFLRYNLSPARIYMGDTGSMFIGYTLAALSIGNTIGSYTKLNKFAFIAPVLILGVPIFDLAFVMFLRFRKGKSMFMGSPDHYSLRLKRIGWPVSRIVFLSYAASAVLSASAMVFIYVTDIRIIIAVAVCLTVTLMTLAYLMGRIDIGVPQKT